METKFRIVETEEYTLAVSDGVKAGDKSVLMVEGFTPMILTHFEPVEEGYEGKKIIAYKPKGNAPELDLPLLPEEECCEGDGSNCNGSCCIVEDDVKKLAKSAYIKHGVKDDKLSLDEQIQRSGGFLVGFKEGYKSATKTYSEEDLVEFCMNMLSQYTQGNTNIHNRELLKESLTCKQSKPKWFVAELEYYYHSSKELYSDAGFVKCTKEQYESIKSEIPTCPLKIELKTTTINNKTYLEGTYLN
jgi:hypothetical protein